MNKISCLITSAGGQVRRQLQALGTGAGVGAVSVPTAVGTLVFPGTLVYICVSREGTVRGVSWPCCGGKGHLVACEGTGIQEEKTLTVVLYLYKTVTVCSVRNRSKKKEVLSRGNNQETFLPRQVRPSGARRRPRGHVQTNEPSVLRQPWEQPCPAVHSSVSAANTHSLLLANTRHVKHIVSPLTGNVTLAPKTIGAV